MNREVLPGDIIIYEGHKYKVGLVGKSELVALKFPELDRNKSINIKISGEWRFA